MENWTDGLNGSEQETLNGPVAIWMDGELSIVWFECDTPVSIQEVPPTPPAPISPREMARQARQARRNAIVARVWSVTLLVGAVALGIAAFTWMQ